MEKSNLQSQLLRTMVRRTEIIDIRVGSTDFDMVADIKKGLNPRDGGEKKLPTLLLYDEVSEMRFLLRFLLTSVGWVAAVREDYVS